VEVLLDTPAASACLARHGVCRTEKTLRKLRCVGGGPKFRRLNGKPYYIEPDLIEWVESRLTAPVGSTSEESAA
jgi:hypothetical protein